MDKEHLSPRIRKLKRKLLKIIRDHGMNMRVGFHLSDLDSHQQFGIHGHSIFPLASVAKLPVMIEALFQLQGQQQKHLSQQEGSSSDYLTAKRAMDDLLASPMTMQESDKCIGSGHLWKLPSNSQFPYRKCLELMMQESDNTSADMVLRRVSIDKVRQRMTFLGLSSIDICLSQRQAFLLSLGLVKSPILSGKYPSDLVQTWKQLSIEEKMGLGRAADIQNSSLSAQRFMAVETKSEEAQRKFGLRQFLENREIAMTIDNHGSPQDITRLLAMLASRQLLQDDWTTVGMDFLLQKKGTRRRLGSYLPLNSGDLHQKTGTILGVTNCAGVLLVRSRAGESRMAMSVFIDSVRRYHEEEAEHLTSRIGRTVYNSIAGSKLRR